MYIDFVVKISLHIERAWKGHQDLLIVLCFLKSLDGPFAFFILIKSKSELIEGLSECRDLVLESLLELIEFLGIELF